MTVYHGSTAIIKNPDVVRSKKYLDFGRGFYVTTLKAQAEKWAFRKKLFSLNKAVAIVNVYELDDLGDTNHLAFSDYNSDWLAFGTNSERSRNCVFTSKQIKSVL